MNRKQINLSINDNTTKFGDVIQLNIGKKNLAQRYFKHAIPTPYEMEMAIIEVEDKIESIRVDWEKLTQNNIVEIIGSKAEFSDIAYFVKADHKLTTERLEFAFNRLTDIVSGSPKRLNEFPDSIEFISLMLILRETMHHLQITEIHLN